MSYTRRNTRPNSYRKIAQPEGHNSAQFLDVVWIEDRSAWDEIVAEQQACGGYWASVAFEPGWYVVRICECHRGEVVIARPYASEAGAGAGVRLLVEAAMVFDT